MALQFAGSGGAVARKREGGRERYGERENVILDKKHGAKNNAKQMSIVHNNSIFKLTLELMDEKYICYTYIVSPSVE